MSTPVDLNIVMPYGVTVEGNGFSNPAIVGAHPKKASGVALSLTPGPCRVAVSWEGPEQVGVMVQNQAAGTSRNVSSIAAGGGGSRSTMVTVGAVAGDSVYLTGARTQGARGTIEVYPLNFE